MDVAHPGEVAPARVGVPLKLKTGMIAAALIAAWLGLMALAIANIMSDANTGVNKGLTLHSGIGPYSGKELVWIVTWFVSWPVLHFGLRNREMDLKRWFGVFLVLLLVAVLLMWPPVFEAIADAIKGG